MICRIGLSISVGLIKALESFRGVVKECSFLQKIKINLVLFKYDKMPFLRTIILFFSCLISIQLLAQSNKAISVSPSSSEGAFPLVSRGIPTFIYVDAADAPVVKTSTKALANDVKLVTDIKPLFPEKLNPHSVIIGTLGKNKLLDQLVKAKKLSVNQVKGKWESFSISIVEKPFPNVKKALVIAGSDPRGTAFGVFELSRLIGVHPFYWWADVHPAKQKEIYISGKLVSKTPSVKYRGIFLNDEDWGLQPWAAKTFEPETGDIGPKTYGKIFELLLRLKANLIWPAMHPSTKAFYSIPGNKKVAEEYAIVVGSSHAEPMLRNNVGEWDHEKMGDFNYLTNKDKVYKYWEDRVKESSTNDAIYTMGMRGVHDSGIEGVKSTKEAIPLLEQIIADQRGLLAKYVRKDVKSIPQAFTAYKEVLDIYDGGLKIPEDVALVWPDDNYGYIQCLNNEVEAKRPGASGVYYHASYWGRPHDYLWLSSTHPALIREEMVKAYENNSNKIWVLNVGDIKPLEYNMQMFLDMAYSAEPFKKTDYAGEHLFNWVQTIFGQGKAPQISSILSKYYSLAFERRPEFMGWSQTEPTTKTSYSDYNHFYYGDEAQRRIDAYNELEKQVKALRPKVGSLNDDAFYQLVYYPVVGASAINKKFLYRDKSYWYAQQNRSSAQDYAAWSKQAYDDIVKETAYYNNQLAGGKWKNMMSMEPRNLPVYKEPVLPSTEIDKSQKWGLAPEGWEKRDTAALSRKEGFSLPAFNRLNPKKYFIDVFLSDDLTVEWKANPKDKWITVSQESGTLKPEIGKKEKRIWVSVDWDKLADQNEAESRIVFSGEGRRYEVAVKAVLPSPDSEDKSFVEDNGYVSMFAANFSRKESKSADDWKLMEGLGYAGNALVSSLDQTLIVPELEKLKTEASSLEYDFYSFTEASPVIHVFTLPTHPLNNKYQMRYGVSIDDGPVTIVNFKTAGRSAEWKQNVLSNSAVKKIKMDNLAPGKHTLKIYAIDPEVILDRILIDLGGLKKAYSLIPETRNTIK